MQKVVGLQSEQVKRREDRDTLKLWSRLGPFVVSFFTFVRGHEGISIQDEGMNAN